MLLYRYWKGVNISGQKKETGTINMDYCAFILCVVVVAFSERCQAQVREGGKENYIEEAIQILNSIFHKYNARVAPLPYPDPVTLDVHLSLVSVQKLDIKHEWLESIVDLEIGWKDARLQWYPLIVGKITVDSSMVWKPQLSIMNAVEPPITVTSPDLIVKSTGTIYWFRRLKLRTYCMMNESNTEDPYDCKITFGSRLNHKREQDFNENNGTITFDVTSAVMDDDWEIVGTEIEKVERVVELSKISRAAVGNFTELQFSTKFHRTQFYFDKMKAEKLESENSSATGSSYLTFILTFFFLLLTSFLR